MIVGNTLVRVTREGSRIPIERLSISDKVYDPIADTYEEIVDILVRQLPISEINRLGLMPVELEKNVIVRGVPNIRTYLSPHQGVVVLEDIKGNHRHKELVVRPASSIGAARPSGLSGTLTYYCIFFESSRYLDANGLSLSAYTLEDISRGRY